MKTFDGTPIATILAANGIAFNMRLVRTGDGYGCDLAVIHDKPAPLIEFYDSRYCCDRTAEKGGEYGQFVSRYYASTLLSGTPSGLNLYGGVDAWTIDAGAMDVARTIIAHWMRGV